MNNKQIFDKIFNKRVVLVSFAIIFLLTTMGGTSSHVKAGAGEAKAFASSMQNITVTPSVGEYKTGVKVLISGSGFEPKQKLKLFVNMSGVSSGIHFMVKPEPVPNELGAFASVWTLRREISKKLIKPLPMVYTIAVVDKDGKTLCTAPLLFCDPTVKGEFPACIFVK
ncbi:MAG: hypothetical protein ACFFCW_18065 [Candidatus Hodarchaeota archaeon]